MSGATGGLVYAGGISGYNKSKITAALHQMYPEVYRFDHGGRNATIAPFLQQKILRDATSLEDAQKLIRETGHFSAWTLVIGDGKTNEVMSMEFASRGTDVARQAKNKPMSQTNHFISPKTAPQARTPYYNKHLESRARMKVLDEAMAKQSGKIDLTFAIDLLGSHQDAFEGMRSFGRTAVKGYGVMSTIAIPTKNEFWITLGERKPASHSTYVGFSIDLDQMTATPIGTQRVALYDHAPNWERSLSTYIDAREAYNAEDLPKSLSRLDAAIAEAEADAARMPEMPHLPYYYVRARLLGKVDKHLEAVAQWKKLMEPAMYDRFMDYQQALVSMYAVVAHDKAGQPMADAERKRRLEFAKRIFDKYYAKDKHPDLDKKSKLVARLLAKEAPTELPTFDFITIE